MRLNYRDSLKSTPKWLVNNTMQATQWGSIHSKSAHSENQDQQKSIATKITVRATGLFFFSFFFPD